MNDGTSHIEHEYGVEHGIAAGCPRCRTITLGSLDERNMLAVTGMSKTAFIDWLRAGSPVLWDRVMSTTVESLIVDQDLVPRSLL